MVATGWWSKLEAPENCQISRLVATSDSSANSMAFATGTGAETSAIQLKHAIHLVCVFRRGLSDPNVWECSRRAQHEQLFVQSRSTVGAEHGGAALVVLLYVCGSV